MALTSAEHQWLVAPNPASVVVGDLLLSVLIQSSGDGSLHIHDIDSGTDLAFNTSGWPSATPDIVVLDANTIAYLGHNGTLRQWQIVDLTSMVATAYDQYTGYGQDNSYVVRAGDWLIQAHRRFNVDTLTGLATGSGGGIKPVGTIGSRLFIASSTTLTEHDPDDMSVITTWTLADSPRTAPAARRGTELWWRGTNIAAVGIDTSTGTPLAIPSISGGFAADNRWWCDLTTGYLWAFNTTSKVTIFDPDTYRWATESLPTSRVERNQIHPHNGGMLIPSGMPTSWPI